MTSDIPRETAAPMQSAGVMLSNERIKRGISIQEVADQIKLSKRQIEAIEADNYDKLPGPTFARGFVRNYARFLEMDAAPLLAWLDGHLPSTAVAATPVPEQQTASEPVAPRPARSGGNGGRVVKSVLLLALLGIAGYIGYGALVNYTAPAAPVADMAQPEAGALVTDAETPPADEVPEAAPATTETPAPDTSTAPAPGTDTAAPPTPSAATATAPAPTAAAAETPAATGAVRILAKTDSWVSVLDADGNKLLYEKVSAGAEKTVTGKPPYRVVIGNAQQAELYFNGKKVDLADKIRGSTAKLTLE